MGESVLNRVRLDGFHRSTDIVCLKEGPKIVGDAYSLSGELRLVFFGPKQGRVFIPYRILGHGSIGGLCMHCVVSLDFNPLCLSRPRSINGYQWTMISFKHSCFSFSAKFPRL